MITLAGRVALVVGGSGGLGRAVSLTLSELGADVAVSFLSHEEAAMDVVGKISGADHRVHAVRGDTTVSADVKRIVSTTQERLGRIDVLVNAAGVNPTTVHVVEMDEEVWDRTLAVNLKGPLLTCKAVAPVMMEQRWGRIINLSSLYGISTPALRAAYGVSKHGLIGLTQCLDRELAPYNVTVKAVCPGPVMTPMVEGIFTKTAERKGVSFVEYLRDRVSEIPMGRLGEPEDVANLVAFIASDAASYISGAVLIMSGAAM